MIDIAKYGNEMRLKSLGLQLVAYSWSDSTRLAVEFVLFTTINKEDGYNEKICHVLSF